MAGHAASPGPPAQALLVPEVRQELHANREPQATRAKLARQSSGAVHVQPLQPAVQKPRQSQVALVPARKEQEIKLCAKCHVHKVS